MDSVMVVVPRTLTALVGDRRTFSLDCPAGSSVGSLLDAVAADHPTFGRRVRDETGAIRRFVNVYVDGEDVRTLDGVDTEVVGGQEVQILQSVAGG